MKTKILLLMLSGCHLFAQSRGTVQYFTNSLATSPSNIFYANLTNSDGSITLTRLANGRIGISGTNGGVGASAITGATNFGSGLGLVIGTNNNKIELRGIIASGFATATSNANSITINVPTSITNGLGGDRIATQFGTGNSNSLTNLTVLSTLRVSALGTNPGNSSIEGNYYSDQFFGGYALMTDPVFGIVESPVIDTEVGYLIGVTSALQTQLNGKMRGATNGNQFGASTTLTISSGARFTNINSYGNFTHVSAFDDFTVNGIVKFTDASANRMLYLNAGKVLSSLVNVDPAEAGYLDGVQGFIQTQFNDTTNRVEEKQQGSAILTNLIGTVARNVTNVISLSTSNATSKPITNSHTSGVLTLYGLEAGANVTVTPNGSNYVIASSGGGSIATNGNQFLGDPLSIKSGAVVTNLDNKGTLTSETVTVSGLIENGVNGIRTISASALNFGANNTNYWILAAGSSGDLGAWRPVNTKLVDLGATNSFVARGFLNAIQQRATNVATLTARYTNDSIGLLDAYVGIGQGSVGGGATTNVLAAANSYPGREITIYDSLGNAGGSNVWIQTVSSQTINGGPTATNISTAFGSLTLFSDGSNWRIKCKNP